MPQRTRVDFHERVDARLSAITIAIVFTVCLMTWRLYTLQVLQGKHYAEQAMHNYTRVEEIPAPRGRVLDRNGRVLLDTVRTYSLAVDTIAPDKRRIPRDTLQTRLLRLAEVIDASPEALLDRFERVRHDRFGRKVVVGDIDHATLVAVQERQFELPGVRVIRGFRRHAVYNDSAGHILGYINEISGEELKRPENKERFSPGDRLGRTGVEQVYDDFLRGQKGRRVLKVYHNEIVENEIESERVDSVPGDDLYLTLDLELQQASENILGASRGAIVIMDVTSGAVLTMASYPRFNPNLVGTAGWSRLLADPERPMFHTAASGHYPPGSVMKLLFGIAGLTDGKVTPQTTFHCSGRFTKLGRSYQPRCWISKYGTGHGRLDLSDSIKQSCDCYFYELALLMGAEGLRSWGRSMNFGGTTGIDLPAESAGTLPQSRYPGDLIQAGIGQERWQTTPLQVTVMSAMTANGGTLIKPHLGDYITHPDGTRHYLQPTSEYLRHDWPPSAVSLVQHAMWRTVNEPRGTGYNHRLQHLEYAGKTGSAEYYKGKPTHAWFTAYVPYENPEYAITIFVYGSGHGGAIAGPMLKQLLTLMYPLDEGETL